MPLGAVSGMLAGLRVIEFSSFIAAPSAGLLMRQLGAEVIRIDPQGGGPDARRWPLTGQGESLYWAGLNRGKQSMSLDFGLDETRAIVGELVALPGDGSGIVLSNAAGRPWLSDAALRAHREDLVHVQVLGNSDGSSAVDYTVNAATGMPLSTGAADESRPVNHVLPAWDLMTGLYAAFAVVTAVNARRSDGQGRHLTISLEDVAVSTLTTLGFLGEAEAAGAPRERIGNQLFGSFGFDVELDDGTWVMVVALTRRHWSSLVTLAGAEAIVAGLEQHLGADFTDEGQRYVHRDVLTAVLRPWFRSTSAAQVMSALADSGVLWSPYRTFLDVVEGLTRTPSPVVDRRLDPHLGSQLATSGPIRAQGAEPPALRSAPVLGADTAAAIDRLLGHGHDGSTRTEQSER